nr:brefeldin A inhibited guanine [Hymenolepis microstoma]
MAESTTRAIKFALEQMKNDSVSEKWQFLSFATNEAINILENESLFHQLPKHKVREMVLAPIQVALESRNTKLNSDALTALEAFVDSEFLYDEPNDPFDDTDLTFQFLDTISPCTIFSDFIQTSFLKLLLKLCFSKYSRLNVTSMLRVVQICLDLYSKFVATRSKEKSFVAQTTLVQIVEAFVTKNNVFISGDVSKANLRSSPKFIYNYMFEENTNQSELSDTQLQILGVLKCLIESLLPDNTTNLNKNAVPLCLQSIAIIVSLLPVSMVKQRVFLNILWQRMCPMLMWFLSNPKQEKTITSTSDFQSGDKQTMGTASSVAPPMLSSEALKTVYDIVIDLTFLVGPIGELRPMLETLFHKMLLYPPPTFRQNALNSVCRLLSTPEGLLSITGPIVSMPLPTEDSGDCFESPSVYFSEPRAPDFRLFNIILESVHACSQTKSQSLVCTSAKCVNLISVTLGQLVHCEGLSDTFVQKIHSQIPKSEETKKAVEEDKPDSSSDNAMQSASLPRSLEVDRWAAHDYLLSLMKTVPSLLDAQSTIELDNLLLEFSSSYCKESRSSVSGGVLSPSDAADFAGDAQIYDVSGTLLNADAVYVATVSALALNYRLLQAGFYSNNSKSTSEIMTEYEFLDSVLGSGLMLYVSETWLSQVYRGIRSQDILTSSGLSPKLLCGPSVGENEPPLRGSCLVEMLIEFDGIGWSFDQAAGSSNNDEDDIFTKVDDDTVTKVRDQVGEVLVSRILLAGWQRIVETLTNTIDLAGMPVDISSTGFASFFSARQPSMAPVGPVKENSQGKDIGTTSLLQRLLSLFYISEEEAAKQSAQIRELSLTLSASLHSLQHLALLASSSPLEALRARCGSVFGLLTETARAASIAAKGNNSHSSIPANRLHSAHALGIHVILNNALRLGCQSPDCWLHLLNACQLVRGMLQPYVVSMCDTEPADAENTTINTNCDLPDLIQSFCVVNAGVSECLTAEQTRVVLIALSAQADQIFNIAAEVLSLPALLEFIYYILQASGAELAARARPPTPSPPESKQAGNLKQAVTNVKDEIFKVARRQFSTMKFSNEERKATESQSDSMFLDSLSQLLLRVIRSPKRPLLHLLRAWTLVSQHLVDACCFSFMCKPSSSIEADAKKLLISQRALSCLHECTVNTITTRLELPYFCANETFCKPFEILLRLEMCDSELQDRIISCIAEVVQSCNSALHSGWRPIFAALRSIKVPFLAEVAKPVQCITPFHSASNAANDADQNGSDADTSTQTPKIPNRNHISTVLEVFEIFLFTDDVLVFCNIAVDCVRCLLRYLSAGELDYIYVDAPFLREETPNTAENAIGSTDEQTQSVDRTDTTDEASSALCKATLPLLRRCCEIFGYLWGSAANVSSSVTSSSTVDYVLRSAKRQAYIIAGGPPQLNLLSSVRSFSSLILHERIKNLTPWFTSSRFFDPTLHTKDPVDPQLCTLRSLDDIDQSSCVLHLWFLTLEGIVMAIWDCNPTVHRIVYDEFTNLLNECTEKICGEKEVPTSKITDGIEREELESRRIAIGPSFAIFVVNHVLMPRLQVAISSNALTGSENEGSKVDSSEFHNNTSPCTLFKNQQDESVLANDIGNDSAVLSKLAFVISQTTQLISSLIIRYQQKNVNLSGEVVGINLMLHQFLNGLVDSISIRNERISRLATSCLRHLLISTAPHLTTHQWEIVIGHLEEAFRACLFPIHTLTTVYMDRAIRSLPQDAGLQLANLRPIGASNKLRQLALRLFQLPGQLDENAEKDRDSSNEDEMEKIEQSCYNFEFNIFPLCTHETGRPPLDTISLSSIISSLVNISLLMHIIGEILLSKGDGEIESSIPKSVQKLLIFDSSLNSNVFDRDTGKIKSPIMSLNTLEFFSRLPLTTGLQLFNCLADSYTAFFEFDQCDSVKKLIQRLLKLQSPANLYQYSHLAVMALQITLQQIVQNGLSADFCSQLSDVIKISFGEFDENLHKLRVDNFRRLPMQTPISTTRGEFVSPLPWLKQLMPEQKARDKLEEYARLLAGLSTHLTQLYLYLLNAESRPQSTNGSPRKRADSTTTGIVYTTGSTIKQPEPRRRRKSGVKTLLISPRRFTVDASTTTALSDMNVRSAWDCLTEDRCARIASLAESLAILPEGFMALAVALETAPTNSPPLSLPISSFSALEGVFACSVARLIAVAEHASLRKALASWFLRLVQDQKLTKPETMNKGDSALRVEIKTSEATQSTEETSDEEPTPAFFEIDELELSDREAEDIDVNHRRIKCISKLETIPNARKLCLRNNLIKLIENLEPLAEVLEDLDLYDNQITKIENLDCLKVLEILDLSYNRIRMIENLDSLKSLTKLYLVNNKISTIENLSGLHNLTMLELGSNKIRKLENLDSFPNLEELYVGNNKIGKLEGLDNLPKLRILSIQCNRITKLEGLDKLVSLEELYISFNGISKIEGLENLANLQTLELAKNRVSRIENIDHLQKLEELWFNDNLVADWDQIEALVPMKQLKTLYMERNLIYFAPGSNTMDSAYRRKILLRLPWLRQLDATLTGVGL